MLKWIFKCHLVHCVAGLDCWVLLTPTRVHQTSAGTLTSSQWTWRTVHLSWRYDGWLIHFWLSHGFQRLTWLGPFCGTCHISSVVDLEENSSPRRPIYKSLSLSERSVKFKKKQCFVSIDEKVLPNSQSQYIFFCLCNKLPVSLLVILHIHSCGSVYCCRSPLTSTWPHLNSDVGLEEGEY